MVIIISNLRRRVANHPATVKKKEKKGPGYRVLEAGKTEDNGGSCQGTTRLKDSNIF